MNVKVSKTVKKLYGKNWKKEVSLLVGSALAATSGRKRPEEYIAHVSLSVHIVVTKQGATVTADPDFLPEQKDFELPEKYMP